MAFFSSVARLMSAAQGAADPVFNRQQLANVMSNVCLRPGATRYEKTICIKHLQHAQPMHSGWHSYCKQHGKRGHKPQRSTTRSTQGTTMHFIRPTLLALTLALTGSLAFAQADTTTKPATTTATAAAPAAPVYKGRVPKLTREALDQYLTTPDKVVLIDLRRPDELIAIGGFPVYLSIQSKELEKSLSFIPRDRDIITISNHAGRAGAGANVLLDKGFKVVGAVGAQDYEAEGGKLTKITAPAPRQTSATEAPKAL
jgi:rhodanese-related sulfurtransferase